MVVGDDRSEVGAEGSGAGDVDGFERAQGRRLERSGVAAGAARPVSTQLICLRRELGDPDLAGKMHATWSQLSTACHAHAYELDSTLAELRRWIDVVARLVLAATPGP